MPQVYRTLSRTDPSQTAILRKRITARLDVLEISSFQASEAIGMHRNFLYDLLVGRKETVRRTILPVLAMYLGVTPDWLLGTEPTVPAATPPLTETAE